MTGKNALKPNGDGDQEVRDNLDQIVRVLDSSDANEILEKVNAGLGNYDDQMLFGQKESYRKGLIAHTGFSSLLTKRAIEQAKRQLAVDGIAFFDEQGNEVEQFDPISETDEVVEGEKQSSWNAEREYGELIWQKLGRADQPINEKQVAAVVKATGLEPGQWIPLFWDMFVGKHEMSRSLDAELIRLYLGESYSLRDETEGEAAEGLLGRKV